MEEGAPAKKRLSLAPAGENQKNVKIDLYRGLGSGLEGARKLGTLAVENDPEGDIELVLEVDEAGNLNASAGPEGSPVQRQSLAVSLADYPLDAFDDFDEVAEDAAVDELNDEVRGRRDQDILEDDSLVPEDGLDSIDELTMDDLTMENLDVPDEPAEPPQGKSDRDILADDTLVPEDGLDEFSLDDLSLDVPDSAAPAAAAETLPDEAALDDFSLDDLDGSPAAADEPAVTPEAPADDALDSFSLDDLSTDSPLDAAADTESGDELEAFSLDDLDEAPAAPADEPEMAALDDDLEAFGSLTQDDAAPDDLPSMDGGDLPDMSMESLSFEDTKLSTPKTSSAKKTPGDDEFSMDDLSFGDSDEPLPLPTGMDSPLDSGSDDFSLESLDLPDSGKSSGSSSGSDFDFPSLGDETPEADPADLSGLNPPEDDEPAEKNKPKAKKANPVPRAKSSDAERNKVDKFALVMSLLSLSVLVLVIVALLVINMLKATLPQATELPEVKLLALKQPDSQGTTQLVNRELRLDQADTLSQSWQPADGEALALPPALAGTTLLIKVRPGDRLQDLDRLYTRGQGLLTGSDALPGAELVVPSY